MSQHFASNGQSIRASASVLPTNIQDWFILGLTGLISLQLCMKWLSCVWLLVTPWTVAYHAPLSIWFSRQEYWSGVPFSSPEDLPDPGIEHGSPALPQMLYHMSHQGSPRRSFILHMVISFKAILSNHPTLSFSHCVQKSVLHVCVSFAALHVGLSVLSS